MSHRRAASSAGFARRRWFALVACLIAPLVLALGFVGDDAHAAGARPARPAGPTAVARPDPLVATLPVGETTTVNLYVQDVANMYGVDIRIKFDPTLLAVEDVDPYSPGVQIQPLYGFLNPSFVIKRVACNAVDPSNPDCSQAGFIWFAVTQLNPALPVSGSGAVAAVIFRGLAPGSSTLEVTYAKAADRNGNTIPLEAQNGAITITSGPPATDTPTPTPTSTPTATVTPTDVPSPTPTATSIPDVGTVAGTVFVDANRNGIWDVPEPGLPGVTVAVLNSSGSPLVNALTGPDGRYRVSGLPLDVALWVAPRPAPGYVATTPSLIKVAFPSSDANRLAEASFGLARQSRLYLPIIRRGI